jgi:short-subunit dehydrogenase
VQIGAGTRALVTGASRGIGRALAFELAGRGATVGLLARDEGRLRALAAELPGEGHLALPADVTDRSSLEQAVGRIVAEAGGLELLVANAGLAHYGPFADQPIEHAEQMVDVNVRGVLLTVKAALGHLLERGEGQIVVVSSGAGIRAFPGAAVYGATKAAERGFAEALRHELSGTGVSVTAVFPGEIATELHDHQPELLPDWRNNDEELNPALLARAVADGVVADRRAVYVPREVRALGLNGVAPRLVDLLLRRLRGASAAPRRD